jgi:hypothetical protein
LSLEGLREKVCGGSIAVRLTRASDFGGEIAGSGHILLCAPQIEYIYRPNYNDPDSLTTLTLANSLLTLASLEELFLLSKNLGL